MSNAKRVIVVLVVLVCGVTLTGCAKQQKWTLDAMIPCEIWAEVERNSEDISSIESMLEENPELINAGIPKSAVEVRDDGNQYVVCKPSYTLLFFAALKGQNEKVKYLISKGADVNINMYDRMAPDCGTALHAAVGNGHTGTAEILIENGANVNIKDYYGNTPLHYAAAVSIKCRDYDNVDLCNAAGKEHEKLVRLLLDNGANINIRNKYWNTPVDYAKKYGRAYIASLIKRGY